MKLLKKLISPVTLTLVFLPLIVVRQWFLPGMPQTHDAEVHISRAAMFAVSISEGNVLPRWAGYFNWGYGTPSIMFLYPGLPYVSALVHLISGLRFIELYKLWMILGYVGSGFLWFVWMRKLEMGKSAALVATMFYLLAPYRLVNIFVRGALAEHLGFFFFPLLMVVFTDLLTEARPRLRSGPVLAVAGIILTHNLSALLYLPIVMMYPFFFKKLFPKGVKFSLQLFIHYYEAIAFGLLLTAFFWVPVLMESKYTLATWLFSAADWFADHFLSFRQLVWSPWGYGFSLPGVEHDGISFQVGIAQWVVLGISAFLISAGKFAGVRVEKKERWMLLGSIGLVIFGMFFTLPISYWVWKIVSILPKFQFPWRFLSFIVIGTSVASAVITSYARKHWYIVGFLFLLPIIFSFHYWRVGDPSKLTEQFLTVDYVGTSDTGETTPIWAVRFQEHKAKVPVEVVEAAGTVHIFDVRKQQQHHWFSVTSTTPARLVDNTLYFPGWTVYVDHINTPVEYQDQSWRGLITFPITQGIHSVEVVFEETLLRKIADCISLVSIAAFIAMISSRRRITIKQI